MQVNEAAEVIYEMVDPDADLIFGAVVDSGLDQDVSITLIATGFGVGAFTGSSSAPFLNQKLPAVQPSQLQTDRSAVFSMTESEEKNGIPVCAGKRALGQVWACQERLRKVAKQKCPSLALRMCSLRFDGIQRRVF